MPTITCSLIPNPPTNLMSEQTQIKTIEQACLQCVAYFAIFSFPLKVSEIHQFLPFSATHDETQLALDKLVEKRQLMLINDFYLPVNQPEWIIERNEGHKRAVKLLDRSGRFARIISGFPFVRGIAISGSLSKFYLGESVPDIDYFIITDPDRLWIARSLLHLFKKLTFPFGYEHYFCMNYFVDTRALALQQRNQYVAIELVTLLPVYNRAAINDLIVENSWISGFLPNHPGITNFDYLQKQRKQPFKWLAEKLINLFFPEVINRKLMNLTDRKWRRKWRYAGFTDAEYNKALQTELHISKNHPKDYEKIVMEEIDERTKNQRRK
jgi:hypothetical protein